MLQKVQHGHLNRWNKTLSMLTNHVKLYQYNRDRSKKQIYANLGPKANLRVILPLKFPGRAYPNHVV